MNHKILILFYKTNDKENIIRFIIKNHFKFMQNHIAKNIIGDTIWVK